VSIDPVSGLATAHAAGVATITAVSGPAHVSTTVHVPAAALTSVSIAPLTPSVPKGLPQQFTATAHYADSSTLDATGVATWSSSDQTLATIDGKGLAKTLQQGTPTIQAQYGAFNASTVLTIGPAIVVSIAVTPNNPGVAKGLSQQFTATGTYTDNSTLDLTGTATWSSTATSVATVNSTGLAQTLTQGSTTIKAVSGVTGSTLLTVLPPALVSIAISGNPSVRLPRPNAFSALGTYSDSSTQDVTTTATWSSSTGVATVNSIGIASPLSVGPTTITAAGPNNVQGTLSFSVLPSLVPRFAYVVAPDAQSLSYYASDPVTGQLRNRGYIPSIGAGFFGFVVDPLGRFVYATSSGSILEYAVNADGSLTSIGSLAVSIGGAIYQQPVIDPAGKFLYVAASNAVAAFAINQGTGALSAVAGSPFAAGTLTGPIVIDPTSKFLYVANLTSNNISGYSINSSTGALTPVTGSPKATVVQPGLTIDPLGRHLYLQGFSCSCMDAFNVDPTSGALTRMSGAPFPSINNQRGASFVIDPAEKFGYIFTNSGLAIFSIDLVTGTPTQLNGSPFASAPEVDFISSSGKFAYETGPAAGEALAVSNFPSNNGIPNQTSQNVGQSSFNHLFGLIEGASGVSFTPQYVYATNMQDNTVSAFSMNAGSGALTPVSGSPFGTGTAPAAISADPTGSFAFVANSGANNVSAYKITNTGALTAVSGSPFASGNNPTSLFADISGRLLYVTNTNDDTVSGHLINRSTGALTAISNSPYSAIAGPVSVVTDPEGSDAFVSTNNQLLNFAVAVTASPYGSLSGGASQTAGTTPQGIAVLPSGLEVYVASKGSNSIFAFQLCAFFTGCTLQANGSFPAHTQPVALAVDPKGRFLYAANLGSNDISIYAINPNGTLVPFPGGPANTGTAPHSLAVDPSGNFLLVADSGSNDVSVFSINQASGALTPVAGSPFATGNKPVSVVVTGLVQ